VCRVTVISRAAALALPQVHTLAAERLALLSAELGVPPDAAASATTRHHAQPSTAKRPAAAVPQSGAGGDAVPASRSPVHVARADAGAGSSGDETIAWLRAKATAVIGGPSRGARSAEAQQSQQPILPSRQATPPALSIPAPQAAASVATPTPTPSSSLGAPSLPLPPSLPAALLPTAPARQPPGAAAAGAVAPPANAVGGWWGSAGGNEPGSTGAATASERATAHLAAGATAPPAPASRAVPKLGALLEPSSEDEDDLAVAMDTGSPGGGPAGAPKSGSPGPLLLPGVAQGPTLTSVASASAAADPSIAALRARMQALSAGR
jgi:hypothetical protein